MICWPVVAWAFVGNHDPALCPRVVVPVQLFQAPLQIFPQAVMLMRAYAFTGRNKMTLICLLTVYISLIAINTWAFSSQNILPGALFYQLIGPTGCFPNYGVKTMAIRIGYIMLAAFSMDALCLSVILVHYYRTSGAETSLGRFFVYQGMCAFIFMLVVNAVTAVLFFLPGQPHTGITLPLFHVLPNLIACRLVLHLRSQVSPTDSEISRRNSEIVDVAFATPLSDPSPSRHSLIDDPWLLDEPPDIEIPVYREL